MSKEDLWDEEKIRENVPKWVISTGYTLLFLSVFINSIGLNLMQINGAITENVVSQLELTREMRKIEARKSQTKVDAKTTLSSAATKDDIKNIVDRLIKLEALSHAPSK